MHDGSPVASCQGSTIALHCLPQSRSSSCCTPPQKSHHLPAPYIHARKTHSVFSVRCTLTHQLSSSLCSSVMVSWCLVPGAWCLVPGAWYLVPGACCLLPGACCLLPVAWCLLPIACCLSSIACCPCLGILHLVSQAKRECQQTAITRQYIPIILVLFRCSGHIHLTAASISSSRAYAQWVKSLLSQQVCVVEIQDSVFMPNTDYKVQSVLACLSWACMVAWIIMWL